MPPNVLLQKHTGSAVVVAGEHRSDHPKDQRNGEIPMALFAGRLEYSEVCPRLASLPLSVGLSLDLGQ